MCADHPDLELSVWQWSKVGWTVALEPRATTCDHLCTSKSLVSLLRLTCTQGVKLAAVKLHAPVTDISFHPADNSCLLTTCAAAAVVGEAAACMSGGSADTASISSAGQDDNAVTVWQLHRLWDRHELQPVGLKLHRACQPTCHAWAPEVRAHVALPGWRTSSGGMSTCKCCHTLPELLAEYLLCTAAAPPLLHVCRVCMLAAVMAALHVSALKLVLQWL